MNRKSNTCLYYNTNTTDGTTTVNRKFSFSEILNQTMRYKINTMPTVYKTLRILEEISHRVNPDSYSAINTERGYKS